MGARGLWTLFRRESLRFLYTWKSSVFPTLITQALYIIVFGSILGDRVREIQGFPYIQFILPGIIILGSIINAFNNSSFSIFHGRWDNYIDEVLTSPLTYWEMLTAYVGAALCRGLITGAGIALIGVLMTELTITYPLVFAGFLVLANMLFACLGVIVGLWAREFGDLSTFTNFLITPLVFLGGVFFSLDMIPVVWQRISMLNPLVYMVNGVRYGMIGYQELPIFQSLGVLLGLCFLVFGATLVLFRRGYGLRE